MAATPFPIAGGRAGTTRATRPSPPVNGDVGNCTDTLASGTSCVPECNTGYVLKGVTTCTGRMLTEVASCVWPFADRSELKAAVDACLDAVPSGERCCSSDRWCWHPDPAMRRCGAVGCVDMPEWDVSQVADAHGLFMGRSSFLQAITGWTFADNANTTDMFTGADTWLSRASRDDDSDTTDGPPGAWSFSPCLEDERVELGVCKRCTGRGLRAAGDDPAAGDTSCTFPDLVMLKTAVDSCLHSGRGDPTGVACCSRLSVNCGAAGTTEMADWDVSPVTSMRELFYGKSQLNADISRWDTSRVTDMYRMFRDAGAFNQDIGAWDTSSVTTMEEMFYSADAFNQPLSRWDVSSVTNMAYMFYDADAFNKDILGWDTFKVTDSYNIFYSADAWHARFEGGGSSTLPDRGWTRRDDACDASLSPFDGDVGTCTDTLASGTSCVPECNTGYVLKGVTTCTGRMLTEVASCVWPFADRSELKATVDACLDAVPSGERCCSSDRWCWHPDPAMRRCGAVGCVDMPDWETGKVTSMVDLFHDNYQFNQSISSWDVARVERFDRLFKCSGTCEFTGSDLSMWDTSSAKSMASMFEGRSRFNSDISRWDVRGVTDMSHMFENASVFTADITRWRTDSLVNSSNMFLGADTWRTLHAQCGKENDPYYDDDTCAHHPEKADKYIDHSSGPPGAWTRLVKRWRRDFFFGDDMKVNATNHEFGSRDGHVSVSYDGKRIAAAGTRGGIVSVRVFEWNEDEGWKRAGGDVNSTFIWPASSVCLATGSDSPWVTRTAPPSTCIVGTRKVAIGIDWATPSNNRPVRTLVTPSRYPETGPCWPSARRAARARFECSGGTPRGHLGRGWESTSWGDPTTRTSPPRDSAPR